MTATWVTVTLTVVSVFLLVMMAGLVIMYIGLWKRIQSIEDVCRVEIEAHVRSYAMFRTMVNSMVRYEAHLARWYNQATGLVWVPDPELAAERSRIEEEIRKATEVKEKRA